MHRFFLLCSELFAISVQLFVQGVFFICPPPSQLLPITPPPPNTKTLDYATERVTIHEKSLMQLSDLTMLSRGSELHDRLVKTLRSILELEKQSSIQMKMMNTQYCSSPVTNGADLILKSSKAFIITPIIDNVPPLLRKTNIRMTCLFISFTFFLSAIRKLIEHLYSSIRLLLEFQSFMNFIGNKSRCSFNRKYAGLSRKYQSLAHSLIKFKWLIKTSKKKSVNAWPLCYATKNCTFDRMLVHNACMFDPSRIPNIVSINSKDYVVLIQLPYILDNKKYADIYYVLNLTGTRLRKPRFRISLNYFLLKKGLHVSSVYFCSGVLTRWLNEAVRRIESKK